MGALSKIEDIVRATEFIGQSSGLQFHFSFGIILSFLVLIL